MQALFFCGQNPQLFKLPTASSFPASRIQSAMHEPEEQLENEPERSSRILVLVIFFLIALCIAVFLIIKPTPGNSSLPAGSSNAVATYLC